MVESGYQVKLVPTNAYKRNIGFGRILFEVLFSLRTLRLGKRLDAPDLIFANDPPQICGFAGIKLSQFHHCPLVVDTLDLWPELFIAAMPNRFRRTAELLCQPLYQWRKSNWSTANGYTALAKRYLDVVQTEGDPSKLKPCCVAYNGIDVAEFRSHLTSKSAPSLLKADGAVWAVFAGTFGPSYDIETIIEVATMANESCPNLKFLLAGDGPFRSMVEEAAAHGSNVMYVGKLPVPELVRLYAQCDIGLCAYGAFSNVEMPDKVYDYMAAGLAIINSLQGEVSDLVEVHNLGLNYTAGDAASLLSALQTISHEDELRSKLKANSWKLATFFDSHVQLQKLTSMIESLAIGPEMHH